MLLKIVECGIPSPIISKTPTTKCMYDVLEPVSVANITIGTKLATIIWRDENDNIVSNNQTITITYRFVDPFNGCGDTISKNSRILTATIYDSTGLPVSGSFQPRIYFRKNYNGSWVSTQGSKQVEKYSNVRLPEQELKYLKSESNIRKSDSDLNNTKNVTINIS